MLGNSTFCNKMEICNFSEILYRKRDVLKVEFLYKIPIHSLLYKCPMCGDSNFSCATTILHAIKCNVFLYFSR